MAGCSSIPPTDRERWADGVPFIRVSMPNADIATTMHLIGQNGDVETWESRDGVQVVLRGGVLVATRGFGFDLMSAERGLRAGPYTRRISMLDGDFGLQFMTLTCVARSGDESQVETCNGPHDVIINTITRDPGGAILRSRQWVSPQIGYIDIRHGP
ncbi:YjbF family lipoprotein [Yoonia sp. 2307UL14-13]|uniref:YjbF family lipoprotein n=1 Tax=Yoonia sp. 2307UL14-13 TaxID=3126506 RepID=UPI0030ACB4C2